MKLGSFSIFEQITAVLWLWSILSLVGSVIGLYLGRSEYWRAFWFMTGLWGGVDAAIALYTVIGPVRTRAELGHILGINAWLDILYLVVSIILMTRKGITLRGFGIAIFTQGLFLLAFDLTYWSIA